MEAVVLTAAVAFLSTNIDDIFLLMGFFADRTFKPKQIVIGQYLGIGALVLASVVCALISLAIAPGYIHLLGFLPIAIGLKKLWESFSEGDSDKKRKYNAFQAFSVAAVTIANGGDNIGVYTPLFATISKPALSVTIIVFAVLTALWCVLGHWFVHNKRFGKQIRFWGGRLLPFVLIGLGIKILLGL
jgi:cadmium resistance protein CadD (predicted permease)